MTDAMHASVTSLSYSQLIDAMAASNLAYEARFVTFLLAAEDAGAVDACCAAEAKAVMATEWAGCLAQAAMTRAIAAEITKRIQRRDYA